MNIGQRMHASVSTHQKFRDCIINEHSKAVKQRIAKIRWRERGTHHGFDPWIAVSVRQVATGQFAVPRRTHDLADPSNPRAR